MDGLDWIQWPAMLVTVAAAWGYLDGEDPQHWAADWIATSAQELRAALELAPA